MRKLQDAHIACGRLSTMDKVQRMAAFGVRRKALLSQGASGKALEPAVLISSGSIPTLESDELGSSVDQNWRPTRGRCLNRNRCLDCDSWHFALEVSDASDGQSV